MHLLESTVIKTCAHYGISTVRTENPGVWVDDMRKICAVGVHLRRNVSSHGVGLNVNTDLWWFNRIVACGLEGREATSLVRRGLTQSDAAAELGISKQAMSQRLQAAGWPAERAGWQLALNLLTRAAQPE